MLYVRTGDVKATAEMLMHSPSSHIADRYTVGGIAARLRVAVQGFNGGVPVANRLAVPAGSTPGNAEKTA